MTNIFSENVTNTLEEVQHSDIQKRSLRDHKRTTVRFTDDEFERIKREENLLGLSIPVLLKKSHFSKEEMKILFNEGERHSSCTELRRIGNNINQIAKKVNSGALEGWYSEFTDAIKMISELHQLAVGIYGLR